MVDKEMLAGLKGLVLDMDGVLWQGQTPLPGLARFFETLQERGIRFVLATNNATRTAVQYTEKLAGFGVEVPPEQILTSAETTAVYLAERYEKGTLIYVVGARGLHDALRAQDFTTIGPEEVENGTVAPLVVMGFTPHITYRELAMGALLVRDGAAFVATNADATIPNERGPLPGAGSLQAVIITATGVEPVIIGKPQPAIFELAMQRLGTDGAQTAMVGDRLETDILGARRAGMKTILVLSGISTRADAETSAFKPDLIVDDISRLGELLRNHEQAH